jgi:hypothetical protein
MGWSLSRERQCGGCTFGFAHRATDQRDGKVTGAGQVHHVRRRYAAKFYPVHGGIAFIGNHVGGDVPGLEPPPVAGAVPLEGHALFSVPPLDGSTYWFKGVKTVRGSFVGAFFGFWCIGSLSGEKRLYGRGKPRRGRMGAHGAKGAGAATRGVLLCPLEDKKELARCPYGAPETLLIGTVMRSCSQ